MDYPEVAKLIKKYSIPAVEWGIAKEKEEAEKISRELGFPVALKIISSDILHKSDAGCVKLNLKSREEVGEAYSEIIKNSAGARFDGMLVQKMAKKGIELIIGGKRDEQFGPAIILGLGGIFVEIFKDFSLRACPISESDAEEMISELKGYPLLTGARGTKRINLRSISELLLNTSKLLTENDGIKELDFNPVIASDSGCVVVDARIID